MNQSIAIKMFEAAKAYIEEYHQDELEWVVSVSSDTFKNLKSKQFLSNYCQVVYRSGFKASTIEAHFSDLKIAFKNFDIESLARMRSIKPVLEVFNNESKAKSFLGGCKMIAEEGFSKYKKRLKKEGVDILEQLPGIGPITKAHLAKNIGLEDIPKPDIWLVRAADKCSSTVEELVAFLSKKYGMSRHTIDVILWRYGADKGLIL